jgi:hypothetical protein
MASGSGDQRIGDVARREVAHGCDRRELSMPRAFCPRLAPAAGQRDRFSKLGPLMGAKRRPGLCGNDRLALGPSQKV